MVEKNGVLHTPTTTSNMDGGKKGRMQYAPTNPHLYHHPSSLDRLCKVLIFTKKSSELWFDNCFD